MGEKREVDDSWRPRLLTESHIHIVWISQMRFPQEFPVEGCRGRVVKRMAMRVHFPHIHVWRTVSILEEVNLTHPW